ncbi:GNAT family N-acetyltransferase [Microbacterium sp. W1N]|uniref:GNAT family N-acetyltransferase n=1 Tax=Microbacterium festucae TaxID=2977531 RepID=UPI0021BE7575|nr:GNAT family N-acetyltransferase [Microbacterium festucae]MCT9819070.1 GNAT family N-acetyltransferase [Microbacterium festucae]
MTETSLEARLGAVPAPPVPTHPDIARWRPPTAADIDALHALFAAADAVDHPTWITPRSEIADTFDLPHIDHARDSLIGLSADGEVVALGSAFLHPARSGALTVHLSGAVHPRLRGRGIGTGVLAWQQGRGRQQLSEVAPSLDAGEQWTADLKVYAEETNTAQQRIAQKAGLQPERWFSTMVRAMDAAAPDVPVPDGIRIVPFSHDRDEDARLARNDAFRDHWGSLPSQPEGWAKFVGGEFLRPDLSRIAVDADGAIVAFCLASVNEDDWAAMGVSHAYIDLIGVVRSHRRRGLAPAVIAGTLAAIADAGLEQAVLDVDTASPTGANTLYEGLGFSATERSVALVERI